MFRRVTIYDRKDLNINIYQFINLEENLGVEIIYILLAFENNVVKILCIKNISYFTSCCLIPGDYF